MVDEPRRSSVVTWILIGLVVILGLGTAGAVAIPLMRCPSCRIVVQSGDNVALRRVRVDGKWRDANGPCETCADRMKVTALNYWVNVVRNKPRR